MMPALRRLENAESGVFLDRAAGSRHEHVFGIAEALDRQDGVDFFAFDQRQQVDDGLATALAAALRQLVNLDPVHAAGRREAQQEVMGVGDKEVFDEILVLGGGGLFARDRPGAGHGSR